MKNKCLLLFFLCLKFYYFFVNMKKFLLFLKWVLMWTCDVIPWVSWWTIAFITWIYDKLIDSLNAFNFKNIKLLFSRKFKKFWFAINGDFLLLVFSWIIIAVLTFAKIISFLLTKYPSFLWSFFFWLILASAIVMRKSLKKNKYIYLLYLVVWGLIWYYITSLPFFTLPENNLSTFISWSVAIIAMILPWISWSYILLILWKYQEILWNVVSLIDWNISSLFPILLFMVWAIIWLLLFSKLLHWIKSRWHDQMVVMLIWFIIWSLNKVWPWKQTISTYVDRHWDIKPLLQKNIFPDWSNYVLYWILLFLFWFCLVLFIQYLSTKFKKSK